MWRVPGACLVVDLGLLIDGYRSLEGTMQSYDHSLRQQRPLPTMRYVLLTTFCSCFDLTALQRLAAQRADLMGPEGSSVPRQRFAPQSPVETHSESPFGRPPTSSFGPTASLRQSHALEEHSFINETDTQLDNFIAQGREVLENLVDQRKILKGTHKRLLDAANTLGLSRNVIGWIEKRR